MKPALFCGMVFVCGFSVGYVVCNVFGPSAQPCGRFYIEGIDLDINEEILEQMAHNPPSEMNI